jgi:SAM-dependent methyltransferase
MYWNSVYSDPQQYANTAWFSNEPCHILMEAIKSIPAYSQVLEIGCGFGTNAIAMAQKNLTVTATDVSLPIIDYCRQSAKKLELDINFITTDYPLMRNAYDVVVDRFVFHMDIPGFAEHVHTALKSNGTWISIINSSTNTKNWGETPSMTCEDIQRLLKPYFNILSIDNKYAQINNERISTWVVRSSPI